MIVSLTAKKNTALVLYVSLNQTIGGAVQGIGAQFVTSPTISAGDAQVSIDGAAFNNLSNLPTITPPAGKAVQFSLSAGEMNGNDITIVMSDQTSPAEWCDVLIKIKTYTRMFDDLLYPTYQLPDSVSADGSIPNLQQSLYMTWQFLAERVVAGTTVTVKNVDGSTTLMTFALNDATNPTSITRST